MKRKIINIFIIIDIILIAINIFKMQKSYKLNNDYQELNQEIVTKGDIDSINLDLVGTIKINNNTYPLVQGQDNDYYLYHDAYKQENKLGAIFVDYRCSLLDANCIIYGHSSKTYDLPFNILEKYNNPNFLENNKYISILYKGIDLVYEVETILDNIPTNPDFNRLYIQTCKINSEGYTVVVAKKL